MADAGSRLLFKFRSGTHGLKEELGRHRGREGNKECELCGNECESVSHVLRECSAYSSSRADFLLKLQEKLGNGFERFDALEKSSFISGSELWEEHFDLLRIMLSTSGRCGKLNYMVMTHPSFSSQPGIWGIEYYIHISNNYMYCCNKSSLHPTILNEFFFVYTCKIVSKRGKPITRSFSLLSISSCSFRNFINSSETCTHIS